MSSAIVVTSDLDLTVFKNVLLQENQSVLESIDRLVAALASFSIYPAKYSQHSLEQLNLLSSEKKIAIAEGFNLTSEWLESAVSEGIDLRVSKETEKKCALKALKHFGLKVSDDLWNTIEDDEVIEIYGRDMRQLYRGLNFFKVCGYSLLEISVYEWYVLWERPKQVIQKMAEQTNYVIENAIPVHCFNLPKHILRETLNSIGSEYFIPRACIAEFLHIGATLGEHSSRVEGFMCTARGEIIAEGSEALSIGFV